MRLFRGTLRLSVCLLLLSGCSEHRATAEPDDFGPAPDIVLTDQSHQTFDPKWVEDKIWIAAFVFTRCRGQCPIMTRHMRKLQDAFRSEDFRLVSISVDPEYDTPEVLSAYAEEQQIDTDRWTLLTGELGTIRDIAQSFRLGFGKGGTEAEPILHSTRLILVDRNRRVRGYYDVFDADAMARLRADIKSLLGA